MSMWIVVVSPPPPPPPPPSSSYAFTDKLCLCPNGLLYLWRPLVIMTVTQITVTVVGTDEFKFINYTGNRSQNLQFNENGCLNFSKL